MNQEETEEKFSPNESATEKLEEGFNQAETINDSTEEGNSQDIDNLPIESIGSYARLEELLTDEEKENTTSPTSQS
jgi:hypothetical protein